MRQRDMERHHSKNTVINDDAAKHQCIVFIHPDLGIGGAERLVIDAAVGLQRRGHKVTIYTSHCDPTHCFDEARDGTLDVRIRGDSFVPATIGGRLRILCAILRQIHLIYAITWSGELAKLSPTIFVLDQLSAGIPWLRWYWKEVPVLFYCHFPDLLLVQNRGRLLTRLWRLPFDAWESWSLRGADRIVANSDFSRSVVTFVFPGLRDVGIIYPCVASQREFKVSAPIWTSKTVLLSINRFERKKNIELAITAYAGLPPTNKIGTRLVLAGGYDTAVAENISYHKSLERLASSLGLKHATAKNIVTAQAVPDEINVVFLLSIPEQFKAALLQHSSLLLYTPSHEHFGIVPLEAMLAGVPVLATNTGGPLETVVDGTTGWLRSANDSTAWTKVMHDVLTVMPSADLNAIRAAGRQRAQDTFSRERMALRFEQEIAEATARSSRTKRTELGDVAIALILYAGAAIIVMYSLFESYITTSPKHPIFASGMSILALGMIVAVTFRLRQNRSAFH